MKRLLIVLVALLSVDAQTLVAKSTQGLVIELKEKYGETIVDTCTVVMSYSSSFVVVNRDGVKAWYPMANYSVRILERFPEFEALVDTPSPSSGLQLSFNDDSRGIEAAGISGRSSARPRELSTDRSPQEWDRLRGAFLSAFNQVAAREALIMLPERDQRKPDKYLSPDMLRIKAN